MKRFIIHSAFAAFLALSTIQTTKADVTGETFIKTSIQKERFETLKSPDSDTFILLLDKHTGNVWQYVADKNTPGWREIFRQMKNTDGNLMLYRYGDEECTNYHRFQLILEIGEIESYYLVDTTEKKTWQLSVDLNNNLVFEEITTD